jgi:hypothetical protein
MRLGQFERAVAVCREALSSTNAAIAPYMSIWHNRLLPLGRFDEVKETCREAFARNLDADCSISPLLFQIGFVENDAALMNENLKWFGGRNDEYLALDLQASAAAFKANGEAAQDFSRRD